MSAFDRNDERYDTGRTVRAALRHHRPPWWRPFARRTWDRASQAVHHALMARSVAAREAFPRPLPATWPDQYAADLRRSRL